MRTEMGSSYRKVPGYHELCSGPDCVLGQVELSLQRHVQWRVGFTGANPIRARKAPKSVSRPVVCPTYNLPLSPFPFAFPQRNSPLLCRFRMRNSCSIGGCRYNARLENGCRANPRLFVRYIPLS